MSTTETNEKEKSLGKQLQEKLFSQKKNGLLKASEDEKKQILDFSEDYKSYLNSSKTEREAVTSAIELAEASGFTAFDPNKSYSAGDKVYWDNRGKSLVMCVFGSEPLEKGVKIAAAHIDSPRIDLKQHPFYESNDICLLKTHYYGGIRKYQWPVMPLALHGVVCKANGEKVSVTIGENEGDPVFVITDLLPHLAREQSKRSLDEGIRGEELNVIIGSMPFNDDEVSEKVKLNVLSILFDKYGIVEDDFLSAELEIVPAFKACDVGLDRGIVGGYGQDDRVCAYTAIKAILDCHNPKTTCLTVLADKEEIGSVGNTGLHGSYLKDFVHYISKSAGCDKVTVINNSTCLSADVTAAYDPTFPEVNDPKNSAYFNYGVGVCKFTGSRGKSGSNDAHAEFVSYVRNVFDKGGVVWQTSELGKVDMGGGGTVAGLIANLGADVIDVGVPVLSMHSPYELTAKLDIYMAYKGFLVYFED